MRSGGRPSAATFLSRWVKVSKVAGSTDVAVGGLGAGTLLARAVGASACPFDGGAAGRHAIAVEDIMGWSGMARVARDEGVHLGGDDRSFALGFSDLVALAYPDGRDRTWRGTLVVPLGPRGAVEVEAVRAMMAAFGDPWTPPGDVPPTGLDGIGMPLAEVLALFRSAVDSAADGGGWPLVGTSAVVAAPGRPGSPASVGSARGWPATGEREQAILDAVASRHGPSGWWWRKVSPWADRTSSREAVGISFKVPGTGRPGSAALAAARRTSAVAAVAAWAAGSGERA